MVLWGGAWWGQGHLPSDQGPPLLDIGLAYSLSIWPPENQGIPFSRKGVSPAELGGSHILCEKSHWCRSSEIPGGKAICLKPN